MPGKIRGTWSIDQYVPGDQYDSMSGPGRIEPLKIKAGGTGGNVLGFKSRLGNKAFAFCRIKYFRRVLLKHTTATL